MRATLKGTRIDFSEPSGKGNLRQTGAVAEGSACDHLDRVGHCDDHRIFHAAKSFAADHHRSVRNIVATCPSTGELQQVLQILAEKDAVDLSVIGIAVIDVDIQKSVAKGEGVADQRQTIRQGELGEPGAVGKSVAFNISYRIGDHQRLHSIAGTQNQLRDIFVI